MPDGSPNTYTYDTLNRLATLANSWAGSFGFSYDALSRRTQLTRPNNVTTPAREGRFCVVAEVTREEKAEP